MANQSNERGDGSDDRNTQKRSAGTGSTPDNATHGTEPQGSMGEQIDLDERSEGTGRAQEGQSHDTVRGGDDRGPDARENQGERGGHGS